MEQTIASTSSSALIIPAFIFGSVVGSFLNVCIYSIPRQESRVFTHSYCTSCGTPSKPYDIIPIVGYIILLGRCRACGSRISPTYLVVELLSGVVSALLVSRFGISLTSLFYLIFLFSLIVVTFIDLEHRIIPNVITLPGIVVGLIYNALNTNWVTLQMDISYFQFTLSDFLRISDEVDIIDSILGIILGGGILYFIGFIYEAIKKREGMGMGDVKLLAMIGAFIGWKGVIFVAFLSSLFGVLVGMPIIFFKRGDLKYAIPYGPFLALAAAFYCFTGGFSFRF